MSTLFVDLGMSPLCQTHITPQQLNSMEPFYPLRTYVCESCFLVQLEEFVAPGDIFSEYAYFSSYADSWVAHAKRYADLMCERFGFDASSKVVEIASNDGYLLQHFVARNVPVLGIEPAANVAKVAEEKGIPSVVEFLGEATGATIAAQYGKADLLLGNNVLAHVPDLNDFVKGMRNLLADRGVITMEFPHLYQLMRLNQFDTIYHEHFSYFSFMTVERVFAAHGITLFDVEELSTHGGSLRIYGRHTKDASKPVSERVEELRKREISEGFDRVETYMTFGEQVKETKREILEFLIGAKRAGKSIVGYGAPGKGNTLLNYCGIRQDFLDYTVDRNPYKQGKYTPGTHIPIHDPAMIRQTKPDYVFLLPWNLKDEIVAQCSYIREWDGQFVVPIPSIRLL
jgi:SAM-dependent methyltransferase